MITNEQLAGYLAGGMAASERETFEDALADDPDALRRLLEQEKIDVALSMLLGGTGRERVLASIHAIVRGGETAVVRKDVMRDVRSATRRRRRGAGGWGAWFAQHAAAKWSAGLAAAALVVFGLLVTKPTAPQPASDTAMARIVDVRGRMVVIRDGAELVAAERFALQTGDEVRAAADGGGVIRSKDGTRVMVEGGAFIRLGGEEGKDMELLAGRVSAEVAEQSPGKHVVLRTPMATVTVHGTAFSLDAAPRSTRLDVREGWVRMSHARVESELELTGGEFALAIPDRELLGGLQSVVVSDPQGGDGGGDRDPALHPFRAESPWNTAIGSKAMFAEVRSPGLDFAGHGLAVLPAAHHRAIFVSRPEDPLVPVMRRYGGGEWMRVRLSPDVLGDGARFVNATVIDPQTGLAHELVQMGRAGGRLEAMLGHTNSLRGSGMPPEQVGHSHSGLPLVAGVIREGELRNGIRHVLAASVIHYGVSRAADGGHPFVWPARHVPMEKRKIEAMADSGNVHFGTLLAIPPDVDITKLGYGTSGPAFEVARALQDYGAYVTHSYERAPNDGKGWTQPHMQLFADGVSSAELRELYQVISKLAAHLRVVTNNTAGSVGGGGQPRRAAAPGWKTLSD